MLTGIGVLAGRRLLFGRCCMRGSILVLLVTLAMSLSGCLITAGPTGCGSAGQSCCAGSSCGAGLLCDNVTFLCTGSSMPTCGANGQQCCSGGACAAGLLCSGGVCAPSSPMCGAVGQACCSSNACVAGAVCAGGVCQAMGPACGALNQPCCAGGACSAGTVCGVGNTCQPMAMTTGNAYSACRSTPECSAGLSCRPANTTTTGTAGSFCTAPCTPGSTCPASPRGVGATCVTVSGTGQCYENCGVGNSCPVGFTCAMVGGSQFCTPDGGTTTQCGRVGDPCCAGNTCTDAGAACASNGQCVLAPYVGCAASSLGQACGAGLSTNGTPVPTSCQRPMIANPGSDGFCTATCLGGGTMCPVVSGRTTNCYLLSGAASGQCFVDCPDGTGCPTGTQCVMVMPMGVAGQVRLCMPPTR